MIDGVCYTAPWGVRQPRSRPEDGPKERVLHVALSTQSQPQIGQESALRRFGPYCRVNWWTTLADRGQQALEIEILIAAWVHRPTLVWIQVQNPNVLSLEFLRALRSCCAPNVMLVLWTGDVVDYQASLDGSPVRIAEHVQPWMIELSQGLDLFSASNTAYPQELVEAGGCSAGFMQCGYDWTQFARRVPESDTETGPAWNGLAAMTAHRYPTMEQESRLDLAAVVGAALPSRLNVWGVGWDGDNLPPGIIAHGSASFEETSWIYSQARVTISTSCTNRMRRYTSGRLQRILGSGGCCAVRSFPDMEGLGLVDGDNCLAWETPADLVALLAKWLMPVDDQRESIRQNALSLARNGMTWNAAFEEMLWMVRQERARRGEMR